MIMTIPEITALKQFQDSLSEEEKTAIKQYKVALSKSGFVVKSDTDRQTVNIMLIAFIEGYRYRVTENKI